MISRRSGTETETAHCIGYFHTWKLFIFELSQYFWKKYILFILFPGVYISFVNILTRSFLFERLEPKSMQTKQLCFTFDKKYLHIIHTKSRECHRFPK